MEENKGENKEIEQTAPGDYMHLLGRDGAYLEIDAENIAEVLFDKPKDEWPKQIVIKNGRLNITDPNLIESMQIAFSWFSSQDAVRGLQLKQLGFLFFKSVFDSGLRYMVREGKKPMVKYGEERL